MLLLSNVHFSSAKNKKCTNVYREMIFGEKRLHAAAGRGDLERVTHFLNRGVNIRSTDSRLHTPLHKAAHAGHVNVARLLVNKGSRLNAQSKKGETPLHRAIKAHNLPMVKYLIEAGAPLNVRTKEYGFTPLHQALFENDEKIVTYLLSKGANPNDVIPHSGMTPLHIAATGGGYKNSHNSNKTKRMMRLLLAHGAKKSIRDLRGMTPEGYYMYAHDVSSYHDSKHQRHAVSSYPYTMQHTQKKINNGLIAPNTVYHKIIKAPFVRLHNEATGMDPLLGKKIPLDQAAFYRGDIENGKIRHIFHADDLEHMKRKLTNKQRQTAPFLRYRGSHRHHPLNRNRKNAYEVVPLKQALFPDEHDVYKNLRANTTAQRIRQRPN